MQRVQLAIIIASAFLITLASLKTAQAQQTKQLRAGLPALISPPATVASLD